MEMPKLGIIGLLVVIVVLILYVVFSTRKEGFDSSKSEEIFNDEEWLYESVKTARGIQKFKISAPVQPLSIYTISDTFTQFIKDTLEGGGVKTHDIEIKTDPIPGWQKLNATCAMASEPQFIPYRDPQQPTGCGWWFNPDDFDNNNESFATSGNMKEPVDVEAIQKKHPNGRWIWDLVEAQREESRKICRRIKICELSDLMPGKCGFCPSLGLGVPINSAGKSLYPNDSDMACGEEVVQNPLKCPRPKSDPAAEKGQKFVRLLCDPDPNTGKLNKNCLIKIAKALGCTENGAIIKILKGDDDGYMSKVGGANRVKLRMARGYLFTNENVTSHDSFFGFGICTRYDVMYFYNILQTVMYKSNNLDSRAAAKFLVNDTDEYDECKKCQTDTGPFELHCVQKLALSTGLQRTAGGVPQSEEDMRKFDGKRWGEIQAHFNTKMSALQSEDVDERRAAAWDIFGIALSSKEIDVIGDFGKISGLSYYIYQWNKTARSSSGAPKYTFFGREACDSFPEFDSETNRMEKQCKKIKSTTTQVRFMGQIVTEGEPFTSKFWTFTDDGININVNGDSKLNKSSLQEKGGEAESSTFTIDLKKGPTKLEVNWYNRATKYSLYIRLMKNGKFHHIPPSIIYQMQPVNFPIARWDFYQGLFVDRCGTLQSEVIGGFKMTTIRSRKCALFSGKQNYIRINNGIHSCAFKTITMMVNLQKNPYGPFRFWEFSNIKYRKLLPNTCNKSFKDIDILYSAIDEKNLSGPEFASQTNGIGAKITCPAPLTLNDWTHLAWVIDEKMQGMKLFVDGFEVASSTKKLRELEEKVFEYMYILHGIESYDKEIAVAWFRIFDYSMTKYQVNLDMENKFTMGLAHPTDEDSGWL